MLHKLMAHQSQPNSKKITIKLIKNKKHQKRRCRIHQINKILQEKLHMKLTGLQSQKILDSTPTLRISKMPTPTPVSKTLRILTLTPQYKQ